MTIEQAIAAATTDLDAAIARIRRRFEQSLIDNDAPAEHRDVLREYQEEALATWRAQMLADFLPRVLAHLTPTSRVQ